MKKNLMLLGIAIISMALSAMGSDAEIPFVFESNDGTKVDAFKGSFEVPENRNDHESRTILLTYVRFPATKPNGTPTVYLAGGPGGSGILTAKGRRFPLFMQMREFGDVIAFDQRGTGESSPLPLYQSGHAPILDEPLTREKLIENLKRESEFAANFWSEKGIDLSAYNTTESAKDIRDLAVRLGSKKINLWGISYGSHLALATIREMPGQINKVVLAAIEGLDQTVKLPVRTDAYFERLEKTLRENEEVASLYPDLKGLMRDVLKKLEVEPAIVGVKLEDGQQKEIVFGKIELQLLTSFMIADPANAANLPIIYKRAQQGDYSMIAPFVYKFLKSRPIEFRGMPEAMDVMSGVSKDRRSLVESQSKTSILGDWLNYPMPHLADSFRLKDLGDRFRAPVDTCVPTLAFSGTLDGRTYPESAIETLAGFSNLSHVLVENGGHNVFMQDPKIAETIRKFMMGDDIPSSILVPAPQFQ